ncbi:zinc finger BED domain-containing protein DAYSLEEPER-like [Ipomoea triloba]|uniref:zinc finger BED domain-containing protein DAYSLEEPER-like n=1 Tax=Ipomoea triloba TaxID=35885 RepID=UPI00125E86C4|nr:zinc finger BED domain-containing protein DAYSLEEPER-like [Ipomoea triloba]
MSRAAHELLGQSLTQSSLNRTRAARLITELELELKYSRLPTAQHHPCDSSSLPPCRVPTGDHKSATDDTGRLRVSSPVSAPASADDEVAAYGPCRVPRTKLPTLNLAAPVKCELSLVMSTENSSIQQNSYTSSSDGVSSSNPTLHPEKFDMELMRESIAHWVMIHEHPFTILEEVGFDLMMKRVMPEWKEISRNTIESDCLKVYETEKKKLKNNLECVSKVSLTIDCWKSKNQKIEYMVVIGHWIDSSWRLQKRVLSFINIPPPMRGFLISNAIFRCMKEWGIEKKVFSITVDNASSNDSTIRYMKDTLQRLRRFDGLDEIQHVIQDVRDSVEYVNRSEARRIQFANCVQKLQLKDMKLIRDCKTR